MLFRSNWHADDWQLVSATTMFNYVPVPAQTVISPPPTAPNLTISAFGATMTAVNVGGTTTLAKLTSRNISRIFWWRFDAELLLLDWLSLEGEIASCSERHLRRVDPRYDLRVDGCRNFFDAVDRRASTFFGVHVDTRSPAKSTRQTMTPPQVKVTVGAASGSLLMVAAASPGGLA